MKPLNNICVRKALFVTLGAALLTWAAPKTQAQTLSLSPSSATAQKGNTVTFTVFLNPGSSSNFFYYDVNVFVDSTYLTFVNPPLFTPSAASAASFPNTNTRTNNTLHTSGDGTTAGSTITYPSGSNSVLRFGYDNDNSDANFAGSTALGTFSVQVANSLPSSGTFIQFGPPTTDANFVTASANYGGSEVVANFGSEVLQGTSGAKLLPPASAPEPSGVLALMTGTGTFALFAARRRITRRA